MISSPPTTASPALPTHTSPTSPSPLLLSCSPPATSMPLSLVDISTSPLPLVDISVDSTCHRRPHSPLFTNWKGITPAPAPPPPLCSASSFLPPQKPMSPPRPSCLPLPTQQLSAISRPPPPRPSSKPSSPPRPRPQPLAASKGPVAPAQADRWQKPPLPNINILEKLIKTCPVWLQLGTAEERAFRILIKESPGIFIVRRNAGQKLMVLSVRLPDQQGEPKVQELLVKEEKALLYLEGSVLVFDNIFKLIAFYCVSRDILPFTLKLPQAIIQATKYEDMDVISTIGLEFWGSMLNNRCLDDSSKVVASGCSLAGPDHSSSCEIQLSAGGDRLWYVNPIFIEEYCNSLPPSPPAPISRTQSLNVPVQAPPKYRRPPPLPPPPRPLSESEGASPNPTKEEFTSEESALPSLSSPLCTVPKEEGNQCLCAEGEGTPVSSADAETAKPAEAQLPPSEVRKQASRNSPRIPPVPLRRRLSDSQASGEETQQDPPKSSASVLAEADGEESGPPVVSLICLNDSSMAQSERPSGSPGKPREVEEEVLVNASKMSNGAPVITGIEVEKPRTPVPPPRRKRLSQALATFGQDNNGTLGGASQERPLFASHVPQTAHTPASTLPSLCISAGHPKAPDVSLFSPEGGALQPDQDSYSTSSTEEEVDTTTAGALVKRTPTIMLGRAKQRLSMVNFSTVFTSFMCADRKLQKRIVELARDGSTYFGSLVQDYRAFTLETMQRHSSSTEMLQEIRQMMTQLKSYLIQSAELQNLLEPATYSEEKLEIIIEASLCKSVLKPLKELIYNGLRDIHSRTSILKKLKENQQIVLATTTTDLGVTTSVPETHVMEKIQVKLGSLHQEYSPQKKINLLLKTCKMIYESMSVGCPGKTHGADDFLPVLLYVLARCNMTCLVLDVEYMMELMDPALQLGEGSYYLTTTYGALEHIKNYDKQAVTRQLSLEIQDSIHRWERRRTLNKARASRSSVQDFINVSFLEAGSNTKTLGIRPSTTAQDLCTQCAEKFEVLDPDSFCLCVLVDGLYRPLTPEELPLAIKSCLHHSEPRKEYYFVYRHGRWPGQEPDSQTPSTTEQTAILEDSLI